MKKIIVAAHVVALSVLAVLLASALEPVAAQHGEALSTTNFDIRVNGIPVDRIEGGAVTWIRVGPGSPQPSPRSRGRKSGNESSAIGTLRTVVTVQDVTIERVDNGDRALQDLYLRSRQRALGIGVDMYATDIGTYPPGKDASVCWGDCEILGWELDETVLPDGRVVPIERMTLRPGRVNFGTETALKPLGDIPPDCFRVSTATLRTSEGVPMTVAHQGRLSHANDDGTPLFEVGNDPPAAAGGGGGGAKENFYRLKPHAYRISSDGPRVALPEWLNANVRASMHREDAVLEDIHVQIADPKGRERSRIDMFECWPTRWSAVNVEDGKGSARLVWTLEVRVNRWEAR